MALLLRAAMVAPLLLLASAAAAQSPPAGGQSAPRHAGHGRGGGAPRSGAQPGARVTGAPQGRRGGDVPLVDAAVVAPRGKRVADAPLPPPGTPIASSPGFSRLEDGTSRIWIEVSRKVDVVETKGPSHVVYRLRGAAVVQRTNQLPLLTGFFSTPVERVQLVPQGPDLDLIVDLREASELAYRVVETPRGMVLQIDFPRSQTAVREETIRDDNTSEPARPRATRQRRTQKLGGTAAPAPVDEPQAPVEDN
jgi:hypothetical protein